MSNPVNQQNNAQYSPTTIDTYKKNDNQKEIGYLYGNQSSLV